MEYRILGADKQASRCVRCGQCLPRCPQGIDIPGWMEKINAVHEQAAAGQQ